MQGGKLKKIAVYCGASGGSDVFMSAARDFGKILARENVELIYGAGSVGLMGALADGVLENGGSVTGVVPRQFSREVVHQNLTRIIYTNSMGERKKIMLELADANVALAGGFGTLDEISEALVLLQLGVSNSPCGFLNTNGFYDKLFDFFKNVRKENFLSEIHFDMALKDKNPKRLLEKLSSYKRPEEKLYWDNFQKIK